MAANTPLKRYKQNTHGGGIRDPLVMAWRKGIAARGELRHQFRHASDLVPTLLEIVGVEPPATIAGVAQKPLEGVSFAASLGDAEAPSRPSRNISRCSATAACGRTAGRRWATIRPARRSSRTNGSSTTSTATSPRPRISPSGSPSG